MSDFVNAIASYTSSLGISQGLSLFFFFVRQSRHIFTNVRVLAQIALYHFNKDDFVERFPQTYFYQNSPFLHTQVDFCFGIYSQQSKDNTAKNYTFKRQTKKANESKRN